MLRQLQLWDDERNELGWTVRRSVRARRLSVRVFRSGGVEIVVPPHTPPGRVHEFVRVHRQWIEGQQQRAAPAIDWPLPPETLELSAVGERWRCVLSSGAGRPQLLPGTGQVLQIEGDPAQRELLRRRLIDWLMRRARAAFEPALRELAAQMQLSPGRLQVRCQRARWGSCSRRATISLNACLLFQRPEVLRYLLVHELSHLRHMNHSERFWAVVARYQPDWQVLDRELTQGWRRVPTWMFR